MLHALKLGMAIRTKTTSAKEAAETLMGMLIVQQTELLKSVRYLERHATGALAQLIPDQIIPNLCDRMNAMRGDRPLAPECESPDEADVDDLVSDNTGLANEFAVECLPTCLTTRLTDFYSDLSRVLIHYTVLHSLALATDDEVLAGIAWNHVKQIKETIEHGMLLIPAAAMNDFGGDVSVVNPAIEQLARIWKPMKPTA
jgi:hypothetical protein